MESNPDDYARAVLVYDRYLTLSGWRTDALFIEARCYQTLQTISIAVPYRTAQDPEGFAVFRPKVLRAPEDNAQAVVEAFWAGIGSHEQAARVWDDAIDQSR